MPRQNKSKNGEQDGNLRPERFMALVTFRQIRYFIAVAESGKISAAASMLGISPSVVTEAVSELETLSRMKLFQRQPRGLDLTYEGHRFLGALPQHSCPRSKAPTMRWRGPTAKWKARSNLRPPSRSPAISSRRCSRAFSERFPNIEVRCHGRETTDLEAGLIDGRHDLALMLVSNLSNRAEAVKPHARSFHAAAVAAAQASAAQCQEIVTLADVAAQPYIQLAHRRCRILDRRLLECAQSAAQHHHSHRIGRSDPQPDRASPRRHDTFRHDVSAVVARRQPHRSARGGGQYSDDEHRALCGRAHASRAPKSEPSSTSAASNTTAAALKFAATCRSSASRIRDSPACLAHRLQVVSPAKRAALRRASDKSEIVRSERRCPIRRQCRRSSADVT